MTHIVYRFNKEIDNHLHKSAFRGKVDKVKTLLDSISPYKTTSDGQTPLHLSLWKGHENVANVLLNILETDLTATIQFLMRHNIVTGSETKNYVFALGKNQIERVRRDCKEIILNNEELPVCGKCTFILMKENIYSVPDILVLRVNDEVQKFKLLSTVFELAKENGVISLNILRRDDHSSVLHLAAARGYTEMVMKLLELGANPYLKDNGHQTTLGAAHSMGEFPTYVEMSRHLQLDMFATKGIVRPAISNAIWEKVEFFIETLITLRMEQFDENRDQAIRSVLSMNEIEQTFLLSNIGEKCLEKYGHYIRDKKLPKIIMLLVNNSNQFSDIVMPFIRRDYTIVKAKTNRVIQYRAHNTVLHSFVRNGWNSEVREIYQEFPRLKTLLFEHKEIGLSALIQCIQSNHIKLAEFLIQEHESDFDRSEHWTQLLIAAAELSGSVDFLKQILNHRMTDPNLVLPMDNCTYTNALFACISKGNLQNLEVLLTSEKLTDLNIIKNKFDVTLLQSAIHSMNAVATYSSPYDFHRQIENCTFLSNDLDTSEDEKEPEDRNQNNASGYIQSNMTRYVTMNKIFDKLVEHGANVKHLSGSYQTLLHHAVKHSNKYLLEKLIQLGLDPIDPDRNGNLPIHYVVDTEIFDVLQQHTTFSQTILAKNKTGESILHNCARLKNVSIDLCSKLIDKGVDVNAVDHLGNSALHYVQSVAVCELLVNCNANLNLRNQNGQTPAHVALSSGNFEIAALLLKQPSLDLFVLTNSGKSYLTMLSSLTEYYYEKIKLSLDNRKEELDRLVELYCNETDDDGVSNLYHSTNNKHLLKLFITQPHIQVNVPTMKYNELLLHNLLGDVNLAKFFVSHGLDVNRVDVHLRIPLVEALTSTRSANVELVNYLIKAGANVNFVGWQGTTPLHVACQYFNLDSIKILLDAKADYNVRDNQDLPQPNQSRVAKLVDDTAKLVVVEEATKSYKRNKYLDKEMENKTQGT